MNFKSIHIGDLIKQSVNEQKIDIVRICNFFNCQENDIKIMYDQKSLDTDILMKWSKLLEYDFFRLYTQHLILYAPHSVLKENHKKTDSTLPKFRKNIYTKEVIDYILDQIQSNKMTKNQVIDRYKIPKTTLYKWISKYKK